MNLLAESLNETVACEGAGAQAESVKPYRMAIISNLAGSITNFRGPLVREMVRRGMTVYALAPDYDDGSRRAVMALGAVPVDYSMARTGMNPFRDIVDLVRMSRQLRKLKLDASFAYFIKPVIYGTLAARLAKVPRRFAMIEGAGYVFGENNKLSVRGRFLRRVVTRLYKFGLTYADRTFLLNRDDRELFINEGMVAAAKVHLLDGIGLDLDHYEPAPPVLKPVCFILIARLMREKGIYDYIDAARKVKSEHPEVQFLLVGGIDPTPGSVTEADLAAWVAEGLIEYPGQVSDIRLWIAQASVFVLPSYYREGLPRSTQEAMAMGRPVITTDWVGCRETVVEGVNGFLVPIRDPVALSRAMLTFVEHPEKIPGMGMASRRMTEERFDVCKINERILGLMKDASHV
jgi:glycosyltransferase involved in cell wall biosynthesis